MSSIWGAARDGDCARLRALLAEGQDVNEGKFSPRMTPLHFAADSGNADAVALLLEHGADVNIKFENRNGCDGWTPLHHATYIACCPRCIALLVAAGADVNAKSTSDSTTPLLRVGRGSVPRQRQIACASLLIQAGARVNDANKYGDTPISAAVRKGHRELAKLLFRAGAVIPKKRPTRWEPSDSARRLFDQVKARGGWQEHVRAHKRVLVGLVTKCTGKPGFPDDAAGLVVEFWCPPGGF